MIGAPIRNEKRAASACLSPATTPATIVAPHRATHGSDRFLADPVAEIEDETIDDQEHCGDRRRGERIAQYLAKESAGHDRRDGRQDDIEERPSVRLRLASRHVNERAREIEPVAPEKGE